MAEGLSLTLGLEWATTAWKHVFGTCSTITENFASCQKENMNKTQKFTVNVINVYRLII